MDITGVPFGTKGRPKVARAEHREGRFLCTPENRGTPHAFTGTPGGGKTKPRSPCRFPGFFSERETRVELATSSLGSWRSTN